MGAITKNGERGAPRPPRAPRSLSSSSPDCSPEVETKGCSFFYENKQNHLTSRQRLLPRSVLFSLVFGFFFLNFFFSFSFLAFFRRRCSCPGRRHHGDTSGPVGAGGGGTSPSPAPPSPPGTKLPQLQAFGGQPPLGGFGGLGGEGGPLGAACPLPAVPPPPPEGASKADPGARLPPSSAFSFRLFFFYL